MRGADRLTDESRVLVLMLKSQLEVLMGIQHLLQGRKAVGVSVDGQQASEEGSELPLVPQGFAKSRESW